MTGRLKSVISLWVFRRVLDFLLKLIIPQHDPNIVYPRIYNDFFSERPDPLFLKSHEQRSFQVSLPPTQTLRIPRICSVNASVILRVPHRSRPLFPADPGHPGPTLTNRRLKAQTQGCSKADRQTVQTSQGR
jgi:hypothetical protein